LMLDNTALNIPKGGCYYCGSTQHTWTSNKCQFFGTEIYPHPCRHCNIGGHGHRICPRAQTGATGAPFRGRQNASRARSGGLFNKNKTGPKDRLANLAQDQDQDNDTFDWMLTESVN
jgi:nitrous oxide reductase accessory protein NosL